MRQRGEALDSRMVITVELLARIVNRAILGQLWLSRNPIAALRLAACSVVYQYTPLHMAWKAATIS